VHQRGKRKPTGRENSERDVSIIQVWSDELLNLSRATANTSWRRIINEEARVRGVSKRWKTGPCR
jgi:hypothetical protein